MENLKKRILKILKEERFFIFGHYIRLYPDTLTKTNGHFKIEITEYVSVETFELVKCTFDIVAIENDISNNGSLEFYESFKTIEELFDYVDQFLEKFKNLRDLGNHVFHMYGFLRPRDPIIDAYFLMRNDLADGTTFEDFLEGINRR